MRRCLLILASLTLPGLTQAQSVQIQSISPGQSYVTRISADQAVDYLLPADGVSSYLIVVEQSVLDLAIEITSPDGAVASYNSPLRRDEREVVWLTEPVSGSYRIRIHSDDGSNAIATLKFHVDAVDDQNLSAYPVDAWQAMSLGARQMQLSDSSPTDLYAQASAEFQLAGDLDNQAFALFATAASQYWNDFAWDEAAAAAAEAAAIYAQLNRHKYHANALQLRGASLMEIATAAKDGDQEAAQRQFTEALALLAESSQIHEAEGNFFDVAEVTNNIGLAHYYMGDWRQAQKAWTESEKMFAKLGEWESELTSLFNQGAIDAEEGRLLAALEKFQRVLDDLPEEGYDEFRADTYDNVASVNHELGNVDASLFNFSNALSIHQSGNQPNLKGVGRSSSGLGAAYFAAGDLERARDNFNNALPAVRSTDDGRSLVNVLSHLGNIEFLNGQLEQALHYHLDARDLSTSPPEQGQLSLLVSRDYRALDRDKDALDAALHGLDLIEQTTSVSLLAETYRELGLAYLGLGDYEQARGYLDQALRSQRSLGLEVEQAQTLNALSMVAAATGNLESALEYGSQSISRLEGVRAQVANPELRAFFTSTRRRYYEHQIDLLVKLSLADPGRYLLETLTFAEGIRARMTLELLQEAKIAELDISGTPTGIRKQMLLQRLAEKRYQRDNLLQRTPVPESELMTTLSELTTLENELTLLETEIRRKSPEFSRLLSNTYLSAEEIQTRLGNDVELLQYMLGDAKSYVWHVTRDEVKVITLASREQIEGAARVAHAALKTPGRSPGTRTEVRQSLRHVSDLVLAPVAEYLSKPTLLIAADGALQYLPFAALPDPRGNEPVLHTANAVNLLSMSVLAAQQRQTSTEPATRDLAIFYDPVFNRSDSRLEMKENGNDNHALSSRAVTKDGMPPPRFQRLPATRREATRISSLFSADSILTVDGLAASRTTVRQAPLYDYRLVHFATHGVIDQRFPALSALVMSTIDEAGEDIDGWLRLDDIYGLRLNADIVVLSGCETGLGREIRGESFLGLTQGFLHAGARNVVASLWQVSDRATAELMGRFYEGMIERNLPPAQALRAAQLSIAASRRWQDPYYWGAFLFVGEWH